MGGLGPLELLVILCVVVIGNGATGFWTLMLIECATKEPDTGSTKVVWIPHSRLHPHHRSGDLLLCAAAQAHQGVGEMITTVPFRLDLPAAEWTPGF
jgi:hypothetical protein